MKPETSVVIASRDSPWVGETLEALAADGVPGPGVEVVVVGMDSHGLVPRRDGVRMVDFPDSPSPGAARNRGVAAAQGARILFTDSDCRPRPGWRGALEAALDRTPVAGGAVTFALDANRWAVADNIAAFHEMLVGRPAETSTTGMLGTLNLGLRREVWETVGPFDEGLVTSEDVDWVMRARAAGFTTAFVPEAVVEHAAVRQDRAALIAHATWYGEHFQAFRSRHPGVFDRGPTWKSRRLLAAAAPLKAVTSALSIFLRHRQFPWRAFPAVVAFKRAWYRSVLAGWKAAETSSASPS